MKAVGETSVNVNLPAVVKNPEVVSQGHLMDSGNKFLKVSESDSGFNCKELETAFAYAPSELQPLVGP